MQSKLKLEHISAYLPYKLKCLYTHTNKIGTISNIYTIGDGYDNEDVKLSIDYNNEEHIWMFKPILRPLSNLAKEIEVNGEKFMPYDYFLNDTENDWFEGNIWMGYLFEGNIDKLEIGFIPYYVIQKLAEWHIDFQGLIEAGLAIDKTTLKN